MKQKQKINSLKKIIELLPIVVFLFGILSCNNKASEKEVKKEDTTKTSTTSANLIQSFKQYKLEIAELTALASPPKNAKKLLLKISLDDLTDPSSMRLWYYPAKNHIDYGESTTPIEIKPTTSSVVFTDTKDILIGNNELSLKFLKQGNSHQGAWLDFDYILFTPIRKNNNLAFNVTGFKNGQPVAFVLPLDTNPSPPAKPED